MAVLEEFQWTRLAENVAISVIVGFLASFPSWRLHSSAAGMLTRRWPRRIAVPLREGRRPHSPNTRIDRQLASAPLGLIFENPVQLHSLGSRRSRQYHTKLAAQERILHDEDTTTPARRAAWIRIWAQAVGWSTHCYTILRKALRSGRYSVVDLISETF